MFTLHSCVLFCSLLEFYYWRKKPLKVSVGLVVQVKSRFKTCQSIAVVVREKRRSEICEDLVVVVVMQVRSNFIKKCSRKVQVKHFRICSWVKNFSKYLVVKVVQGKSRSKICQSLAVMVLIDNRWKSHSKSSAKLKCRSKDLSNIEVVVKKTVAD